MNAAVPASGHRRPRTALVIGSGALKCIAAFGAVKVLQREGIGIDMVVGCSGGSFCAVWFALGAGDADEAALRFSSGWEGSFDSIDYRRLSRALLPPLWTDRSFALLDDRRINASIAAYAGDRGFADAAIPLFLVATDAASGERVVLSDGRLSDAIRASIAIPLLLPPWPLAGQVLIDGGVSDPLPIDVAMREGADVIIAMGFEEHLEISPRSSLLQQLMHLKSVTVNNLIRAQYAFYSATHHAEVILLTPEFDRPVGLRALHQVPYLLREGERAAEAQIPYLRRLLRLGMQKGGSAP